MPIFGLPKSSALERPTALKCLRFRRTTAVATILPTWLTAAGTYDGRSCAGEFTPLYEGGALLTMIDAVQSLSSLASMHRGRYDPHRKSRYEDSPCRLPSPKPRPLSRLLPAGWFPGDRPSRVGR